MNVWMTPFIVVVDPESGRVTSIIDCRKLVADAKASDPNANVLNGIAWDSANHGAYLSGERAAKEIMQSMSGGNNTTDTSDSNR